MRVSLVIGSVLALVVARVGMPVKAAEPSGATGWNPAAAAQYLDARMDLWWTNAKTLKTGDRDARCLSCHTAVPYALARPVLRRLANEQTPTAHEERIAETASVRVNAGAARQPFYDNSENKKRESRGVESVLNALVLTSRDLDRHVPQVGADTAAALSQMWDAQRADGTWDWLDFGLEPYEAPDAAFHGATLAAIAAGRASRVTRGVPDAAHEQQMLRLRSYLTDHASSQRLFNQAWALLAAAELKGAVSKAQQDQIVSALKTRQRADGGWSLSELGTWRWDGSHEPYNPPGTPDAGVLANSDGYATGLVVYALRQAHVPSAEAAIARGRAWLTSHQQAGSPADAVWAPWRAFSLNHDREHGGPRGEPWRRMFMSDLATSFAVLSLAD